MVHDRLETLDGVVCHIANVLLAFNMVVVRILPTELAPPALLLRLPFKVLLVAPFRRERLAIPSSPVLAWMRGLRCCNWS